MLEKLQKSSDEVYEQGLAAARLDLEWKCAHSSGGLLSMANCGHSLIDYFHYVDAITVGSFQFADLDFVGVSQLIDAHKGGDGVEIAQGWLDVLSTFDPTGWLAAASAFVEPICTDLQGFKYISDETYEVEIPSSAWDTVTRPYCLGGVTFSWVIWSDEPGLCLPPGQLGRVEYEGRHCGNNKIQWTRAKTIDRVHHLPEWQCQWDWMVHPDKVKFAGECGTAPSISGGLSLPTTCIDNAYLPPASFSIPTWDGTQWISDF